MSLVVTFLKSLYNFAKEKMQSFNRICKIFGINENSSFLEKSVANDKGNLIMLTGLYFKNPTQ